MGLSAPDTGLCALECKYSAKQSWSSGMEAIEAMLTRAGGCAINTGSNTQP